MVDPHGKVHPISGKSWKEAHNIYSTFVLMCIISRINKLQITIKESREARCNVARNSGMLVQRGNSTLLRAFDETFNLLNFYL